MTVYRTDFTYASTSQDLLVQADATDFFTINGSNTNNVYVLKMGFSCYSGAAAEIITMILVKRSTPNLGGTTEAPTYTSYNSMNPPHTATVVSYTANPATLGTLVGGVWEGTVGVPLNTTFANSLIEVDFRDMFAQPLTLLSPNESLSWSLFANNPALEVSAYVVWTEVPKT